MLDAAVRTVWDILICPGRGYFIPSYQRQFAWGEEDIERIIDDAIECISDPRTDNPDLFLGAVVMTKDDNTVRLTLPDRSSLPGSVMLLIDGQQRLSTLTIINIILHNKIFEKISGLKKNEKDEKIKCFIDKVRSIAMELEGTFYIDRMTNNNKNYRYYPRIIRAYNDKWSEDKNQALYKSPIARYVWQYINSNKNDEYTFNEEDDKYKLIRWAHKIARDRIDEKLDKTIKPETLFRIIEKVSNQTFNEQFKKVCDVNSKCRELLKIIALAKFINHGMSFVEIVVDEQGRGLDIFDAMNTTGQPLTAFETFVPKITADFTPEKYRDSEHKKQVDIIQKYLDWWGKPQHKATHTQDLLISFALAEDGTKLPKQLTKQRNFLIERYERKQSEEQKAEFLRRIAHTANYYDCMLYEDMKKGCEEFFPGKDLQDTCLFMQFLVDLNHYIVVAPLSRFFGVAADAADLQSAAKLADLQSAVKFSTAFSILWRAAYGITNGIDGQYRKAAEVYCFEEVNNELCPQRYKQFLVDCLKKEHLLCYEEWSKKAEQVPIYKKSQVIARFLLFLALNDSIPDKEGTGLIKKGKKGVLPILTLENWDSRKYTTLDHVAPQNPPDKSKWDPEIYLSYATDRLHVLGNLMLLPREINSKLGNHGWSLRKLMYELHSCPDQTKVKLIVAKIAQEKNKANQSGDEFDVVAYSKGLRDVRYSRIYEALANYSGKWDYEFIKKRTANLLKLAHTELASWLDLDST